MTDADLLDLIRLSLEDECGPQTRPISRTTTAADVPGWDSLAHVRIMMNLEVRLNIDIDIAKTYRAETLGDLIGLIRPNLATN